MEIPTLAYALLAVLARGPATGYELAARLKDPISHFWEAGHSQIYPALARLQTAGLVEVASSSAGPGPRPRKSYAITDAGLDSLRRWVGEPARRWGGRDELILKVYASWVARPSATIGLLREAEQHHASQLRRYLADLAELRNAGATDAPPHRPAFASFAVLRRGIGHERGRLAWCRWLIRRLEAGAPPGSVAVAHESQPPDPTSTGSVSRA